ncbi:hypothetical protein F0562_029667 [Nyssa sinensis]|uniref:Uncharacterized protein n=1 Tax=Nyssa sinensis TaxID=561372 RepID=A0A5J5B7R5_9ASTE|nr:hypothetical protein F0562_029667 [Nyssa sinensis]
MKGECFQNWISKVLWAPLVTELDLEAATGVALDGDDGAAVRIGEVTAGNVADAVTNTYTTSFALLQVQSMHSDAAILRKASIWHEAEDVEWNMVVKASLCCVAI